MLTDILLFLLPVGKFILATALLVFFYQLFYKEKTTFDQSRVYLLSIVVVALLISQFHVVVFTPPVRTVVVEASQLNQSDKMSVESIAENAITSSAVNKVKGDSLLRSRVSPLLTAQNIALMIYGLATLILIYSFIIQYFKIRSIRRRGVVCKRDGFEIVESADIPTPFSFGKTIFIGTNISGNKLDVVLKHEQWHIKHHHYVDVMIMELLVRILWFNPVLWWVRKELRNVSEYQTDRSVLDEGHDLYKYQTIILEEVMAQNPYLANGFNNSFTQKRFLMMKNNFQVRFTMLRRIVILPFLVSIFCLLCLTTGKAETRYVTNMTDKSGKKTQLDTPSELEKKSEPMDSLNSVKFTKEDLGKLNNVDIDKQIQESSEKIGKAIIELDKASKATNPETVKQYLTSAFTAMGISFNNVEVGGEKLSDELCESITRAEIENTRKTLMDTKKEIDQLKTEKSTIVKAQKLTSSLIPILQDGLITKVISAQVQILATQMQNLISPLMLQMDSVFKKSQSSAGDSSVNLFKEKSQSKTEKTPTENQ